ncbi:MAG: peptidoglycan DD-metalloendopeptidase family protein [Phaeodactylibacter sp.]|nr:peptidoglycan DD-metalloendopeptidase family protein [Phaeodactylibacter sp.]
MGKEKFIYNTHTLRYEKVEITLRERILRIFGFVCVFLVSGFIFTLITWNFFPSPKEDAQSREIEQLKTQVKTFDNEIGRLGSILNNVQERDANVHRMMFGMDPIDPSVWEGGVGGHEAYPDITKYKNSGDLLVATRQKLDKLKRKLTLQSISLDTIQQLAQNREKMLASIPSIKPVRSDKLARKVTLLSGFGYRIHPVFKIPKKHTGIDFTAPYGTPIQATGDGVVANVLRKGSGYGHHVIIDHGYGYQTLYGHMSRIDVKPGQKVKKGQQIGLVGSTGTSTAPHCHYEVIYNNVKINPIDFCLDGLTPEEYQHLKELADVENQSFD